MPASQRDGTPEPDLSLAQEQLRTALASYEPGRTDRREAKPAAALLLLYERDNGLHVLFQERSHQVEHHKGEISFPGGARDETDSSAAFTALRETEEEVGVAPRGCRSAG